MKTLKHRKLIILLTLLFSGFTANAQNHEATDDYMQVLTCYDNTVLDVLLNDAMIHCNRSDINLTITNGSKAGATTMVDSDKNIVYTRAAGFIGRDMLEYSAVCNGTAYTAKAFISVVECPDNIADVECFGTPQGFLWDIKEDWRGSQTNVSTYVTPIVADLNGDGIPEILVGRFNRDSGQFRIYDGVYVYWGHNRSNPTFVPTVEGTFTSYGFSVAKVNINGIMKPILVMPGHADGYLYAYDPTLTSSALIWKSSHPLSNSWNSADRDLYTMGFADFDGDGEVEIYAGGLIFDASTGVLLAEVPAGGNKGYFKSPRYAMKQYCPFAADVTGDGIVEYIAGTEVYSVNIVNRTGTAGNKMTLIASIPPVDMGSGYTIKDGATVVADINGDGRLDVVVHCIMNTTDSPNLQYGIMVWDVQTQTLIAKSAPTTTYDWIGNLLIGNIDNEPNLEILLTSNTASAGKIDGFRWDGNQTLNRVYTYSTSDRSGGTGITLFDFNQDGVMELVYRDETDLRIMQANPGTGTFTNLRTIPATSGTSEEYPIVADVDNDGAAEIVVVGGTTANATQGSLRIYKSGNQYPWAPARKVWNQYAYNVVNINEDLTIPRYQMNPATFFPNGKQPFNAYLQQQTLLNTDGDPYWSMPNIIWTKEAEATVDDDAVTISGCIKNIGDAALQAPFYVTFYKNDTIAANIIALQSVNEKLMIDSTLCFNLTINNIGDHATVTSVWISINDRNGDYPYQTQCMVDGRREIFLEEKQTDDNYLQILTCYENTLLDVLLNNTMITCNRSEIDLTITSGSKAGATVTVDSDKNIVYTRAAGFIGRDTLEYRAVCNGTVYTAKAFISVVECPDNISNPNCYGEPEGSPWSIREAWKSSLDILVARPWFVGDLDGDGLSEIVAIRNYAAPGFLQIVVFPGNDRDNPKIINADKFANYECISWGAIGRVNNKGMIFVIGENADRKIHAYEYPSGNKLWVSDQDITWSGNLPIEAPTIGLADFNGDGIPEIYVGNKIFNAVDGKYVCGAGSSAMKGFALQNNATNGASLSVAVDIDGDGLPELVCGNEVYKVDIAAKTMTLWKKITPPTINGTNVINDGHVSIADFNGDGFPDVLVSLIQPGAGNSMDNARFVMYGWDVINNEILFTCVQNNKGSKNIPLIGDLDGDGKPEILVLTQAHNNNNDGAIYVYRLPATLGAGATLSQMWRLSVDETWGRTGITLFDFNQDGKMEIVYRDMTRLRIIDGNGQDITTFPSTSSTTWEYPIVADVDGDGMAEIVCAGGLASSFQPDNGYMTIYKPDIGQQWAPARKVWNQYAYNAVNVNDDLTIPRYQMNPATFFPNGKQPFNAFLQQQTLLNTDGDPYWSMSNIIWETEPTATIDSDAVSISGCIKNIGDAALQAPFYVTFYKNDTIAANIIELRSVPEKLMPDSTLCFDFTVNNISSHAPITGVWISINDRNGDYPYQAQCMVDGRRKLKLTPECYSLSENLIICQNELPYTWRDTVFDAGTDSKQIIFERQTAGGCDSIVTLDLTVKTGLSVTVLDKNVCQHNIVRLNFTGVSPFEMEYTFNGVRQTTTIHGMNTILIASLTGENLFLVHRLESSNGCSLENLDDENDVKINDIVWATRNVDAPGTFTQNPEDAGMFYPWNSVVGWSSTDPLVSSDGSAWKYTYEHNDVDTWEITNNVCPPDYRVPTVSEMESLANVAAQWKTINGINGMIFGSEDNTIFLPAAGQRIGNNTQLVAVNLNGYYWSATYMNSMGGGAANAMQIAPTSVIVSPYFGVACFSTLSVRCVKHVVQRDTVTVRDCSYKPCENGEPILQYVPLTLCQHELPYTWRDTLFDVGTESQRIVFERQSSIEDCDSIVTLNLTINPTIFDTIPVITCDSVLFYGQYYSKPGLYTTILGCEMKTLDLTLNPVPTVTVAEKTVCQNEAVHIIFTGVAPFELDYTFNGTRQKITVYGMDTALIATQMGENRFVVNGLVAGNGCSLSGGAGGVEINGIIWATRNVDAPGTFAAKPEDAGMFYQWNRTVGWSSTDPLVSSDGSSWSAYVDDNTGVWATSNNICPAGYRIPTHLEQGRLTSAGSQWVTLNGVNGRLFGSGYETIFLPATGGRISNGNLNLSFNSNVGRYWSSMGIDYTNIAHSLEIWNTHILPAMPNSRNLAFSVRCVKDSNQEAPVQEVTITVEDCNIPNPCESEPTVTVVEKRVCQNDTVHIVFTGTAPFELDYTFNGTRQSITVSGMDTALVATQVGENIFIANSLTSANGCLLLGGGVEINGIIWATRNVDTPGAFTDNPEDFGMFYQWNRPVGWSSADPMVNSNGETVWDNSHPAGTIWEAVNNVCPAGYRVPTDVEAQSLIDAGSQWTTLNGVNGRVFGSGGNTIFLPVAGYRDYDDGTRKNIGLTGHYWLNMPLGTFSATLGIQNNNAVVGPSTRTFGFSLRCVTDIQKVIVIPIEDCTTPDPCENGQPITTILTLTTCQNESVLFNGKYYNQTGTYSDTLTAVNGCDSIVTLRLTVNPAPNLSTSATMCQTDFPYVFRDTTFQPGTISGNYVLRRKTVNGCDSTVTLRLTVVQRYELGGTTTICQSDLPYTFRDTTFRVGTISDDYVFHRKTKSGCDSVVTLRLIVNPVYNLDNTAVICQSDLPYVFRDTTLRAGTTSGDYVLRRKTKTGCDSIMTLRLTVNQTYTTRINATINIGEGYSENGFSIPVQNEATAFSDTLRLTSRFDCDSMVILNLKTCHPNTTNIFDTICAGEPYYFGGKILSESDVYFNYEKNAAGCDSVIVLDFKVLPSYYNRIFKEIVEGETYLFHGEKYSEEGIYSQNFVTVSNCDSVEILHLGVLPKFKKGEKCPEIEIPIFFTPNSDGVNDYWRVKNIECYNHKVTLYDRFGKELSVWDNNFHELGWDGTYLGKRMPSTDYWYVITLEDGRDYTGHFTLLR